MTKIYKILKCSSYMKPKYIIDIIYSNIFQKCRKSEQNREIPEWTTGMAWKIISKSAANTAQFVSDLEKCNISTLLLAS